MFHRGVRNDGCFHKAVGDVDVERGSQRDEADWGVGGGGCGGGFQEVVGGFRRIIGDWGGGGGGGGSQRSAAG